MHIEVIGWTKHAEDEDERERLSELATHYLTCAIESESRERDRLRSGLPNNPPVRTRPARSASSPPAEASGCGACADVLFGPCGLDP
jgi:hypothetical protein